MLRKITRAIGRFRVGDEHDYPRSVWTKIAESAKMPLDKFSTPVEHNPVHQSAIRTRPMIHTRLGATQ